MQKNNGRIWAYSIAASILLVFGFCVATIVVTQSGDIQSSDDYMSKYQVADLNANSLISAKIEFDKKYKAEYINDKALEKDSTISYKIMDLDNNPINSAKLTLAISRPDTKEFNQNVNNPKVENGIYTFSDLKFPKEGVWNLILKVDIENNSRFYNIKADTRNNNTYEY